MSTMTDLEEDFSAYICDSLCGQIKGKSDEDAFHICEKCKVLDYLEQLRKEKTHE